MVSRNLVLVQQKSVPRPTRVARGARGGSPRGTGDGLAFAGDLGPGGAGRVRGAVYPYPPGARRAGGGGRGRGEAWGEVRAAAGRGWAGPGGRVKPGRHCTR